VLIVFRGLPGTGKSYLVRMLLERRPGLLVLSRDALRACIIPWPTFTPDEKALVDDLVVRMAAVLLARGCSVVIDGMALSSAERVRQFADAADAAGAGFRLVECVCSEQTALARIAADGASHLAGDRGENLYFEVKARFEPAGLPALFVDTEAGTQDNLRAILSFLDTGRLNGTETPR
jgi:predicted kinase